MNLKLLGIPVLALAALLAFSAAGSKPASAAGATWNIVVGQSAQSIAANDFLPDAITIHEGDTIHFASPSLEPHTVSYVPAGMATPGLIVPGPSGPPQFMFNPDAANATAAGPFDAAKYYNSGLLQQNSTADLTFPTHGTFTFLCLLHGPTMSITVNVVNAAVPVQTQAQLDAQAKAFGDELIADGVFAAAGIRSTSQLMADGSHNWSVQTGGGAKEADILQFNTQNITIAVGDTVTWTNPTATPHTVTFLDAGDTAPPLITPVFQPSGPPLLTFTAKAFLPAGGATYNGSGYTNSGFFDAAEGPTNKYALKFTAPGTYKYLCLLHADQGMVGTITVAGARPTPVDGVIGAPNTGTGPVAAGSGSWWAAVLMLGITGAALVLAGTRLGAKRAR